MEARRPVRGLVIGASETTVLLHMPALARLRDEGRLVLAEVCDLQHERAAAVGRRFGFLKESGDGLGAIASPGIDAVYIFGSAQLHYEYGLEALQRGKHLFVEKPVAPNHAKACELARAARAGGLIAVGGQNRRFYKALAEVRARAGKAGWRFAEATFHKSELGRPAPFGARTWLGANGIHALDALVFMMGGLPEQLTAMAGGAGGEPNLFSALMRWPDGRQGAFLCDNAAGSRREDYVFHGPGETCRVGEDGLVVEMNGVSTPVDLPTAGDGFAAEHDAFLEAIETGEPPAHSLDAIAPSLFLAELIEQGFSGRVRLPALPVEPPPARSRAGTILVAKPLRLQRALAQLLPHYRLMSLEEVEAAPAPRPDVVAAILGPGSPPLPAAVLDKLPDLKVVGAGVLSLARLEPEALLARGITLVNPSEAYAESVAEFAFGLAILGRRRAFLSHEVMRRGGWGTDRQTTGWKGLARRSAQALRPALAALGVEPAARKAATPLLGAQDARAVQARDLGGAVVGLVGWGANARAFAVRLVGAGARVIVHSEHAAEDDIREAGAEPAPLGEALAADIVSLHRGLTPQTRHCLGAAELARLRPGAVLINIARGGLIEPKALVARLKRGDVFACLDTFEAEPPAASHPLRRLPNVFLTSHIAGGSPDMHAAAAEEVVGKVAAFLDGRPVKALTRARLKTMT
jgi:phosphoglycerate dehydrogenase-like enzyme/predicted dehydrogenase